MSEVAILARSSLERLLARSGDEAALASDLDAAGLLDALSFDDEPFAVAGSLAEGIARGRPALPAGDSMVARWMLRLAGLDCGNPFPVLVPPASPGARLRRSGNDVLVNARFVGVPWTGAPLVSVLPLDGVWQVVLLPSSVSPIREWANLAEEPRADLVYAGERLQARGEAPAQTCGDKVFLVGAFLRSAQLLGAMDECAQLSVRYAKERHQFGRPIGHFQAVQHLIAQMCVTVALVRAAVEKAAAALDRGAGAFEAAAAKALASAAAGEVAAQAHQVHGAIGFTREHALGGLTRRLWAWRDEFGDERFWQSLIGRAALGWRAELWSRIVDADGRADGDVLTALREEMAR